MPKIFKSLRKLIKDSWGNGTYTPSQSEHLFTSSSFLERKIYLKDLVEPECSPSIDWLHTKYQEPATNIQQLIKKQRSPDGKWEEILLLRIHTQQDESGQSNATFQTELTPKELKEWVCNINCYPAHFGGNEILEIKKLFQGTPYAFGCAPEWASSQLSVATPDLIRLMQNSSASLPSPTESQYESLQTSSAILGGVTLSDHLIDDFATSSNSSFLSGPLADLGSGHMS